MRSAIILAALVGSVSLATAATTPQTTPDAAGEGAGNRAEQSKSVKSNPDTQGAAKSGAATQEKRRDGEGKPEAAKSGSSGPEEHFDIDEYRVEGADALPQIEVEEAVYPFLGPNRTAADVEKARAALEKSYHDKGYQTVSVAVPQQDAKRGFIVLKVTESRVGRLRVKGSRYFDLDKIKRKAASLKEGDLPNFNEVTKDIVSLNQWPDRRVTPALRAGVTPGTVDVDLNVEDKLPLHGSAEINNRQSPNTTPLRTVVTAHYDNLWQAGHSATFTFQVAPLRPEDVLVYSGSYLARTNVDWLNILLYGFKSASNVATVGGTNVVGPGAALGVRGVITLPSRSDMFQTLSVGWDYKRFDQTVSLATDSFSSPVTYVPLVGTYSASWQGEKFLTQFNTTLTTNLRGLGSDPDQFDAKRYKATSSFAYMRGDVSHTQELPWGMQLFAKAQWQLADQALVSSEQFSLGGLDTVRGYLETEALGDYGGAGTLELRTPNIAPYLEQTLPNPPGEPVKINAVNEWRFFAFADAGRVKIKDPLPDQQQQFDLASYGFGTRFKVLQYFNSMILVGVPLIGQQVTLPHDPRLSFRMWGEF